MKIDGSDILHRTSILDKSGKLNGSSMLSESSKLNGSGALREGMLLSGSDVLNRSGTPGGTGRIDGTPEKFKQVLDKALAAKKDKELKEAAKQLEALLIYQMFTRMRETVAKSGLFEEGVGETIFQGLLDQEISLKAADSGSFGLAEMIYQQLKRK